jgi:hypothetical protein
MDGIIDLLRRRIWLGPVIALAVGLAVGLILGWSTVDWKPNAQDVAAIADSYSLNNDGALAKARLQGLPRNDLARMLTDLIRDSNSRNLLREADRLYQLAQLMNINISPASVVPTSAPQRSSSASASPFAFLSSLFPFVLLFLVAGLIAAAILVFVLRILPTLKVAPAQATRRPAATAPVRPPIKPAPPATASKATPPSKVAPPPKAASLPPGSLGRFVATYTLGNDNYDTSFSLEAPPQDFMGECGMGISETIGEGRPDKVTAFDLWLFDKGDVRTVTQIIMSQHAFADQALRTKLAAKGTAILAERGKTLSLDTQSLHLDAKILDMTYANTPGVPANSHFQKLTVEFLPKLKETVAA